MKVQRYYPAYYDDSYERTEHEVSSKDELLALPFVKDWETATGFEGWCYDKSDGLPYGHLMCIIRTKSGLGWYVVAVLFQSRDTCPETWFGKPPYLK